MEPTQIPRTVTIEEYILFRNSVNAYYRQFSKEKSKLSYAIKKMVEKYEKPVSKITKEMNEKIEEQTIRCASTKDGNLIENRFDFKSGTEESTNVRFSFTPEKKIELEKYVKKLTEEVNARTIEISPFLVEIPQTFDWRYFEAFKKFVFKEISEQEEIELYLAGVENEKVKIKSVLNGQ